MAITLFKKKKTITRDGHTAYLNRWNLFECGLFSIKIHQLLLSDHDCLHDHPWAFVSLILRGGYVEHRLTPVYAYSETGIKYVESHKKISRIYHPGNILYRKATDTHKLELHQPAWTLVVTFKKVRNWGFVTKKGWVPWYKYNPTNSCE